MSIWISTALTVAAASATAPASETAEVETFEYTIRKGDSCAKVATEVYGDRKHYEIVHQYNRWLGPTLPHHLQEGQVLILPKTLPPALPDAEVTAAHRTVEARPPETPQWSSARPGLDLYRGWRVNTQQRASAEITFRDYSRIEMRQNTLVIIYGGSRSRARRETTEATLDRGALRARLGAYTGKTADSEVTVTTPSAVAELDGGTSLVTVDDAGTSRVANHGEGKAQVSSSSKRGGKVKVGPRMGSKVVKDTRPSKPRPLPPTPRWSGKAVTTFVAAADRGTIHGTWAPEEKAAHYRVEIAKQPDGRELVASQTVPAAVTRFEAQGLPAGDYYVSIAAIDDDAFESPPSDHRKLSLVSVPLLTPGGAPLPELGDDDGSLDRVLRGTRLDVPRGLRCGVDGAEPSRQPVLGTTGDHTVECITDDGVDVPGFSVSVVDVEVAASRADDAVRGETTSARFTLSADVPLPRRVWVEAPEGILVGSPKPSETAGEWVVTVYADQAAPAETSLQVMAEAGGTEVQLGEIPLQVGEPSQPAPTPAAAGPAPTRPERHIFELGLSGGVMLPSSDHALYQAPFSNVPGQELVTHQPLRRVAPHVGLRVGYYPIRWVGVEMEHGVVPTRTRTTDDNATVFAIRGQVVGQLPWRITPTVHVGGGALGVSGGQVLGRDIDQAMHFGAGAKLYLTRWVMLRLDVRDVITKGFESRFAHSPEILLGVSAVFGRRSAASPTGRRLRAPRSAAAEGEVSSSP